MKDTATKYHPLVTFKFSRRIKLELLSYLNLSENNSLGIVCLQKMNFFCDLCVCYFSQDYSISKTRKKIVSDLKKIIHLNNKLINAYESTTPVATEKIIRMSNPGSGASVESYLKNKRKELLLSVEGAKQAYTHFKSLPAKAGPAPDLLKRRIICSMSIMFELFHQWGAHLKGTNILTKKKFGYIRLIFQELKKQKNDFWIPEDRKLREFIIQCGSVGHEFREYRPIVVKRLLQSFIDDCDEDSGKQFSRLLLQKYRILPQHTKNES